MSSTIDAVFGPQGHLSRAFANYTPRAGQVALASAVERALAERRHLLAEAPTATGKSVAYSVPAIHHVVAHPTEQVVIVTANLALQDQLLSKDLPMLAKLLPERFTYAEQKGRGNYVCLDAWETFEATLATQGGGRDLGEDAKRRQLPVVREFVRTSETGDLADLPFEIDGKLRREVTVPADLCKKQRCRFRDDCFAERAHDRARAANIVVTNYHMLLAHLRVWEQTRGDYVLPPFRVAICDEVHALPKIASDAFGFSMSAESFRSPIKWARDEDKKLEADRAERAVTQFFHTMNELRVDRERYKARLDPWKLTRTEMEVVTRLMDTTEPLLDVIRAVRRRAEDDLAAAKDGHADRDAVLKLEDEVGTWEKRAERVATLRSNLHAAFLPILDPLDEEAVSATEDYVFHLEERERGVALAAKLLRPARVLRPCLFDKVVEVKDEDTGDVVQSDPVTVIGTSATITTGKSSFSYILHELGAPRDRTDTLVVPSPFEWGRQALFVVPADANLPLPNDAAFGPLAAQTLDRIIRYAGGRTLGLFTSRRAVDLAYDLVRGTCERMGLRLLKQGDMPRPLLIRTFREDVRSVLLGTESLWTGVDVPGEACSVVVIDRIPFARPDDPILDALSDPKSRYHDPDWFQNHQVPRAIIAFRQGFGRLIRSASDRGAVVCLDTRLLSGKSYAKQFLKALPPVTTSTRLSSIVEWLHPEAP